MSIAGNGGPRMRERILRRRSSRILNLHASLHPSGVAQVCGVTQLSGVAQVECLAGLNRSDL